MFCDKCGSRLVEGVNICPSCGTEMKEIMDAASFQFDDSSEVGDFDKQEGFDYSFDDESVSDGDAGYSGQEAGGYEQNYDTSYNQEAGGYEQNYDNSYNQEAESYEQNYDNSYNQEAGGYEQNYDNSYNQEAGGYEQNYDTSYNQEAGGYEQNYDNSYYQESGGYEQNYDNSYNQEAGGYEQNYDTSYNQEAGGYEQNYDTSYNQESGGYEQNYDNSYNQEAGGYEQNYDNSYNQEAAGYDNQYNISYEDNNTNYSDNSSAGSEIYAETTNSTPVMVGNKKYINIDNINIPADPQDVIATGGEETEDDKNSKKVKSQVPKAGGSNKKLIIIISSVVGGILLLVGIALAVVFLTDFGENLRNTLLNSKITNSDDFDDFEDEYEDTLNEIDDIEDNSDATDTTEEEVAEGTEEVVEEAPEAEAPEETEPAEEEDNTGFLYGEYMINTELPVYIKCGEIDNSKLQLSNSNSGYTMTLEVYPTNEALTQEHCNELVKNMIPISEYGNVAVLIYDEDANHKDVDSFSQPFIANNFPQESDNYAMIAIINHPDATMDFSVYVGGEFKNIIPNNSEYAKFEEDMNKFGSVSKGFLYALNDWLYARGYELYGYNPDRSLFRVIVLEGPLKLRKEPSSSGEVVNLIYIGEELTVYEERDGWYYVEYYSDSGWIKSDYCEKE